MATFLCFTKFFAFLIGFPLIGLDHKVENNIVVGQKSDLELQKEDSTNVQKCTNVPKDGQKVVLSKGYICVQAIFNPCNISVLFCKL